MRRRWREREMRGNDSRETGQVLVHQPAAMLVMVSCRGTQKMSSRAGGGFR